MMAPIADGLAALVDQTRDGLAIFDGAGRLVRWNAAAAAITGWRADDAARLREQPAGVVKIAPGKWIELRRFSLQWDGQSCDAHIFTDITAQVALEQSQRLLREVGLVDPVTGLFTEAAMVDHLRRALSLAARDERWVGLLCLALRRHVPNGPDGRLLADEVIRQCARRVSLAVRRSDQAVRLDDGGIAVVLSAMRSPADIRIVGVRLLLDLAPPALVDGPGRSVAVVMGGAVSSDRSEDPTTLIARARAAALQAQVTDEPFLLQDPAGPDTVITGEPQPRTIG